MREFLFTLYFGQESIIILQKVDFMTKLTFRKIKGKKSLVITQNHLKILHEINHLTKALRHCCMRNAMMINFWAEFHGIILNFVECGIDHKVESPYQKNFNFKKAEIQLKSS